MWNSFRVTVISVSALGLAGCSNLPGNNQQQGAVIGGATGAAVGAAVTSNRALGAVIGGAVGAAGGYVVGKNKEKIFGNDNDNHVDEASRKSQESPATAEQARSATTADINSDGFVTLDEVIALQQAGLADDQIVERLRATHQVFNLTEEQRRYLLDRGVSQNVVDRMLSLNQETRETKPSDNVIGKPSMTF